MLFTACKLPKLKYKRKDMKNMKRPIVLIVLFIMTGIFTCIGVGTDTSWLAMLGAIESAIFGTIISMIFESIDSISFPYRN